jgi:hypothetical protein
MRATKRWFRLRMYLLGRWLMHRYQKPLVFDERVFDDYGNERYDPMALGIAMRERTTAYFHDAKHINFGGLAAMDWNDKDMRARAKKTRNGRLPA